MKTTIETPDPIHRTISVELPWPMLAEELDREYRDLAKKVTIKGFRKGKVPRTMLRQRYSERVNADVLGRLIQEAYEAVLIQNNIQPVAVPELEQGELKEGEPYKFVAKVEVQPEVEIKTISGFDIKIEEPKVTQEMLSEEIERLRLARSVLVPVEGRDVAQKGDTVIIDYEASRDGQLQEGGKRSDHQVELGSGSTVPGFEEEIIGMKVGDEKEFDLEFPKEGFPEDLAGKTMHFLVVLKALKQRELPELDDEFAKDLGEEGVETADDVRAMVERRLREGLESKAERDAKTELIDKLLEANPVPVPPALVERQKASMLHELQSMLQFQGLTPDQISENTDKMLEDLTPRAEKEVASAILLGAIADKEGIEVSDDDVETHLNDVAAKSGENIARLKALYADSARTAELKANLRRDKVVDHLMNLSNIGKGEQEKVTKGEGDNKPSGDSQ